MVENIPSPGEELTLPPEESHHLKVRRVVPGEKVIVLDGKGREGRGCLMASGALRIQEVGWTAEREPLVRLTLYMALLKRDKMAFVIQKATELGVAEIVPVITKRGLPPPRAPKVERWIAIAKEALKQCGGTILPQIHPPRALNLIEGRGWMLWEGEKGRRLPRGLTQGPQALVVGPEGGWEMEEVELLKAKGFVTVTLGPRILRAETAAVVGSALLLWG